MAFIRAVLLLVLSVIGAYVGLRLGTYYITQPTIRTLIGDNARLMQASQAGFTVIGLIMGMYGWTRVTIYLSKLADDLREMPATDKIAHAVGAIIGLLLAFLLSPMLNQIQEPLLRALLGMTLVVVLAFLCTQAAVSMREELRKLLPPYGASPEQEEKQLLKHSKILDTNIIIDGRIADICRSGFIEGTIYVPGFVLDELQLIADSGDGLKRARGRRGLDILNAMQKEFPLVVRTYDHLIPAERDGVDSKLVRLAKAMESTLVTNDFNLNKVAELQGVPVLNVNELANALKPVVLPGEELTVHVVKDGKEPGQGVAYLDDGTMVVIENARRHVGETVEVVVASVLQTVAGKMIFGNLKEVAQEEEELMDRNLRSYYPPGERTGRPDRGDRGARRGRTP